MTNTDRIAQRAINLTVDEQAALWDERYLARHDCRWYDESPCPACAELKRRGLEP